MTQTPTGKNPTKNIQRYSCYTCHLHFEADPMENPVCPKCGETRILLRCTEDPEGGCHCSLTVNEGIKYCPVCKEPICPHCGDHDVSQISRVIGIQTSMKTIIELLHEYSNRTKKDR